MKKIMHVAEPFATGVLSFLVDITKRQVKEYEVYILYGVRPLTPKNVEQHIGLPQGPSPPSILASSLTPICLSSIRVLNIVARSFTSSLKSTLPSAVK